MITLKPPTPSVTHQWLIAFFLGIAFAAVVAYIAPDAMPWSNDLPAKTQAILRLLLGLLAGVVILGIRWAIRTARASLQACPGRTDLGRLGAPTSSSASQCSPGAVAHSSCCTATVCGHGLLLREAAGAGSALGKRRAHFPRRACGIRRLRAVCHACQAQPRGHAAVTARH